MEFQSEDQSKLEEDSKRPEIQLNQVSPITENKSSKFTVKQIQVNELSPSPSASTEGSGDLRLSPLPTQDPKGQEAKQYDIPKVSKLNDDYKKNTIKKFTTVIIKSEEIGESSENLAPRQDLERENPVEAKEEAKEEAKKKISQELVKKKISTSNPKVAKVIGWIVAVVLAFASLFAVWTISLNAQGEKSETWPWGGWYLTGVLVDLFIVEPVKNTLFFIFFKRLVYSREPGACLKTVVSYTTGDDITEILTAKRNRYIQEKEAPESKVP
jgi:hypothetical protein